MRDPLSRAIWRERLRTAWPAILFFGFFGAIFVGVALTLGDSFAPTGRETATSLRQRVDQWEEELVWLWVLETRSGEVIHMRAPPGRTFEPERSFCLERLEGETFGRVKWRIVGDGPCPP